MGTGIDPLTLTEKYGTDALRFGLTYQTTGIQDMRFNEDVILMGKKFTNKFWNIARYILLKVGDNYEFDFNKKIDSNRPIIAKLKETYGKVNQSIDGYNFGEAAHIIYDFIWHDLADKYLEETKEKNDQETIDTLSYLLAYCLKLLHPFMPFVTEDIYSRLPVKNKRMLIVEDWPTP